MIDTKRVKETDVSECTEQGWRKEKIVSVTIRSEYETNYAEVVTQDVENEYAVKHRLLVCTDEEYYTEEERYFIYKNIKKFVTAFEISIDDFVKNPTSVVGKTAMIWNDGTPTELIPFSYLKLNSK